MEQTSVANSHQPAEQHAQAHEETVHQHTSEVDAHQPTEQHTQAHEETAHETTTQDATSVEDISLPAPHAPPKPSRLINLANIIDPAISNNPVLSAAIQVLDQISEVGKVMPFVAPAFVLLKIIIDLEKRANEVDVKCNDLIERITFMLSHLPVLEQVEITPSIRKVVDGMKEAMKDAAALIAAYRKQGKVARRLRLSNREKFITCADAVNKCSGDLLMSLQIHQTVKLDILTRAVPSDVEDVAAENFVSAHGGSVDAVVHNQRLVGEFAQQQHLTMDDSVMEQLNANLAELIRQNHAQLESILHDNVNSSIVDGLRTIAWDMLSLEAEQKFTCVQCEKEFTARTNGPNACSFHLTDIYQTKKKLYECCNSTFPCQSGTHRAKHHCDYPYGNFFPRIRNILSFINTFEQWAVAEDEDYEGGNTEHAYVGRLFSWSHEGPRVPENTLYVMIGSVWYRGRYYFSTFTAADLREVGAAIQASGDALIFRTSPDENAYAMGEWVVSDAGEVQGIRISAKAATSTQPYVRICPIDSTTCLKGGEVVTVSKGGLCSYTPSQPYTLPPPVYVGPELKQEYTRAVRSDFKAEIPPTLRVILKTMSNPPLHANEHPSPPEADLFYGAVSLFNNNENGSQKSVSIMSVSAMYRLVGDAEYAPVAKCQLLDGDGEKLPITIEPRQSWKIKFSVTVPRTEDDAKLRISWKDAAFVARYRPVRIKLILEDVEGAKMSLVLEYVHQPISWTFKQPNSNDLYLFSFDNYITFGRQYVHITSDYSKDGLFTIHGAQITPKMLKRIVYRALKTQTAEVDLGIGQEPFPGEWAWSAWALVDLSCQSVYAFKIIMHDGKKFEQKHFGAVYYVPCPAYGEREEEVRPIQYASESATLPPLEPYTVPEFVQDDDVDDEKTVPPPAPLELTPAVAAKENGVVPPQLESAIVDLNTKLASVDANLSAMNTFLERIAVSFEKLVKNIPSERSL